MEGQGGGFQKKKNMNPSKIQKVLIRQAHRAVAMHSIRLRAVNVNHVTT